ncbi:MAG: methyl-accepting chemotaxis protein [Spirochaetes bacterium]|nr:methyl-accepting chemotaxis protein [Spirochaetota bacterium]
MERVQINVDEDKINRLIIIVLWSVMIAGTIGYTFSQLTKDEVDMNRVFFNLFVVDLSFIILNLISTAAFIFIKKRRKFLKYLIITTFTLVYPAYWYASLNINNDGWAFCFMTLAFVILHVDFALIVYEICLILIINIGFYTFFWDEITGQMIEVTSHFTFRIVTMAIVSTVSIMITLTIRKVFKNASLKEEELAEDREVAVHTLEIAGTFTKSVKNLSEKTSNFINTLTNSSENQATNVEEIASSTEELMASLEEINKNTNTTSENLNLVVDEIQSGMKSLNNSRTEINELVNFSKIMFDSIEKVNDIAENTTLLALNAAIEAARAGTAGKGFAVVANEIQKLAEKSTLSAQDVSNLLLESGKKISNVSTLNNRSFDIYSLITQKLEDISKVIQQISFATQELDSGGKEIARNLESINQESAQNYELAKEILLANNELKDETKKLDNIVSKNKTTDIEFDF